MSLASILQELGNFSTALVANTISYIDPTSAHTFYLSRSIQSVTPSLGPTVGVAVTCELDSSTPGGDPDIEGYWSQLDEISQMEEPAIWVVKTVGSRPEHECVLGDGMAKTLYAVGCIGVLTDGGIRDVRGLLTTSFAAYCKGMTIHHGALRFRNMDHSVELGGVTIRNGDIIHADSEGVIRIPEECLEELPAKALRMVAFETEVHSLLRRTDITPSEKRRHTADLLEKYGFGRYDIAK